MADNTFTQLSANFKRVYGETLNLLTDEIVFQKAIPFREGTKLGDELHEHVILQLESGITYAGPTDDVFAIAAAAAGLHGVAKIQGYQHMARARMGYAALSRSGNGNDTRAFRSVFDAVMLNLNISIRRRIELDMVHGQTNIGVVSSFTEGTKTLIITEDSWCPLAWAGQEGATINVFSTALDAGRATDGAAITIASINLDTRTIVINEASTGIIAGDKVFFKGQYTVAGGHKSQIGLRAALATAAGTLYGIAITKSLWKPNVYSLASTQLTFRKLQKAALAIVKRGHGRIPICAYVSPTTFVDLLDDEVALRRHTSQPGKGSFEVGAEGITFHGVTGRIKIMPTIAINEGVALLLPDGAELGKWSRVGSSDVEFSPLKKGEANIVWTTEAAGFEVRLYSDQSVFTNCPSASVLITDIANAA